ncbi:MAG: response regulator [Thermodesulfobacteriota bacterium]|nr:response regulator [Thermodesulfobacteriota bacterium]
MKVLVAEDDLVSRKLLVKIVEAGGHNAIPAGDGEEAWELFKANDVRMVITDWEMPRIDGLALCRKIREADLSHYVYFILLTGRDRKEDAVEGLGAGADDYIRKPFDHEELKARIRSGRRIVRLEEEHKKALSHLIHSEKLISIGHLAAGVAHEINNPTGFVSSNLKTLLDYQNDISELMRHYGKLVTDLKNLISKEDLPSSITEQVQKITDLETEVELDFVLNDIPDLIGDCQEGTDRIKKIVIALKDFAHPGETKPQSVDINKGIETTLNVVWNELKYKATVTKEYGEMPPVRCHPQQLNQVFMNILVNAAQAIEKHGEISISTQARDGWAEIRISDTGPGISEENLQRIFDPFFTTKEVGKGTGLGLNVAYNIIKKHKGVIDVESSPGKGTTFVMRIPIK